MEEKTKILIVDDEYLERTLIRMGVNWDKNGFEIIGEAESCEEAFNIIEKNSPDIIFTDICMPVMNGLDFIKELKKREDGIKIVIITGHRNFDYARTAVALEVTDFLLKPINLEEILKISLKLKDEIKQERKFINQFNSMKNILEENKILLPPSKKNKKYSNIVENSIKLIEENIGNSELSLNFIAGKLFVNSSYLSRKFKKEVDQNITNYIMKLRIVKSIELLNTTNLKEYEIAEKVGIHDAHYFSICFKKYTGRSINKFKKGI